MRNYMLASMGCLLLLSGCTNSAPPAPVSAITASPIVAPEETSPQKIENDNINVPKTTVPPVPSDW
ncbi:MAG: hypothetical protein GX324_01125 [Aeromonadales bacterium]|nr:hypothetical protein [Aeromonadales bacterium]